MDDSKKQDAKNIVEAIMKISEEKWEDKIQENKNLFKETFPKQYQEYLDNMETASDEEKSHFLTHPATDFFSDIKFG